MLKREFPAEQGVVEGGRKRDHRIERVTRLAETGPRAPTGEGNVLRAQTNNETRARRKIMRDLAEARKLVRIVARAQTAHVARIGVRVGAVFDEVRVEAAKRPPVDGPERSAREHGVKAQLLVKAVPRAPKITEALVRRRGPIIVVTVNRFHPGAARDGREPHAIEPGVSAAQAGGGGALFVAPRLIAERAAAVVIERKLVEAVVHLGQEHRAFPAPSRREIGRQTEPGVELVTGVGRAAERGVAPKAVTRVLLHRQTHHETIGLCSDQWATERKSAFAQRVFAETRLDASRPKRCRRVGHQAHDAPGRVGPERTGLRPAQDLDLADIKRAPERAKPREIEIIDKKTHRGIRRLALVLGVLTDAADLKIPRSRSAAGKREIGNPVGQVAKMTDRPEAQGRFIEDRHARRNLREWGSPEIGRDAHGRQRHGAGRLGRLGGRQRRGEREAEKRDSNRRMHGG